MMTNPIDTLIQDLVAARTQAAAAQLIQIVDHVAAAPFVEDLLEVDAPLWGGFWHFDVLGPGYMVPAVELALLRAMRLDGHWPEETTVDQFLTDLRRAVRQPHAGLWTLPLSEHPGVAIAAIDHRPAAGLPAPAAIPHLWPSVTVVWYCATTGRLHAGYRTDRVDFGRLEGAVTQRATGPSPVRASARSASDWLAQVIGEKQEITGPTLAARLDTEILRLRLT